MYSHSVQLHSLLCSSFCETQYLPREISSRHHEEEIQLRVHSICESQVLPHSTLPILTKDRIACVLFYQSLLHYHWKWRGDLC